MKYCSRCTYPNNNPYGMIFDSEGVCMGCRVHEEKDTINWEERLNKLKKIIRNAKKNIKGDNFDCIVPVTGGGDSYFTLHIVKNILEMNPLIVNYNSHYNTRVGIRNLANLSTVFDCDLLMSTNSPELVKKITKKTLQLFGSIYWQVLAGYTTFPVQTAVKYKIPLIIWGCNGWSEQTGMYSHLDEAEMTERCRKEHALMGYSAESLIDDNFNLKRSEIQNYIYPYDNEIERIGIRGIYLSNYIRWDSKTQHEKMIDLYGYETAKQQRTFNSYEDVHCFHSAGLHDYLKYIKLGYSKVTDHTSREIRLKRMTRSEGVRNILKYREIKPNDLGIFLDWIEMKEEEFWSYVYDKRDSKIWLKSKSGDWSLKDCISNHEKVENHDKIKLEIENQYEYKLTKRTEDDTKINKYLLMGRNYIDKYNYGSLEDRPEGYSNYQGKWNKNLNK